MTCGHCGAQLEGRFCGECGADSHPSALAPLPPDERPFAILPPDEPPLTTLPPPESTSPTTTPPDQPSDPGGFPDIGQAFHTGWQALVEHFNRWAATISIGAAIIVVWIIAATIYNDIATHTRPTSFGSYEYRDDVSALIAVLVVLAIVGFALIQMAFARAALAIARGQRVVMANVWSFQRFPTFLGAILIESLIVVAGGPLFLIVAALVIYAPFIVIDRRGSAVTGIFHSISMTTAPRRFWHQLLLVFLVVVISLGTYIGCYTLRSFILFATEGESALAAILAIAGGIIGALVMAFVWSSLAFIYVTMDVNARRPSSSRRTF